MRASTGILVFLLAGPALAEPPGAPPAAEAFVGGSTGTAAVPEVLPVTQVTLELQTIGKLTTDMTVQHDGSLSLGELADLRGGEAIVIQHTTQTLTAVNSGNSVNGDTIGSGAVNLGSGAFNGYDGIGNFVINTGHNNNLQGSISVSIAMTPQ
jgi:hypothetical protein